MLTGMAEDDWGIVLEVFAAARSGRGQPGRDDRKFLEALHFFTVHNITWRRQQRFRRRSRWKAAGGGLCRQSLAIGTASGSGSGASAG